MFLDDASIELFGSTGARYTPTFSAPHGILGGPSVPGWIKDRARPAAEAQVASFQAAVRAGVRVVAGTDAGTPDNPHGGVAREVAFMVEAGLDTLTAVRAATGEAADLLGVPDRGVLRRGRRRRRAGRLRRRRRRHHRPPAPGGGVPGRPPGGLGWTRCL